MPATLIDTNVWLAISFDAHPGHALARQAFQDTPGSDHWLWCRATQQSYLRLMATPALHRAYGSPALSNRDARPHRRSCWPIPEFWWLMSLQR